MALVKLFPPPEPSGTNAEVISFEASPAISLLVASQKAGYELRHDCGGKAICGTCRVLLLAGKMSPISDREKHRLSELGANSRERLACQARAGSDLEIQAIFPLKKLRSIMNTESLKPGLTGVKELVVSMEQTASHLGSGGVPVYATPMMVLAMEEAARVAVEPFLEPGYATVGYHLDIKHLAATGLNTKVKASATLLEINGKMLKFKVEAHDEHGLIGEGSHVRAIINLENFKNKLKQKTNS